jgi:hypothetical protein
VGVVSAIGARQLWLLFVGVTGLLVCGCFYAPSRPGELENEVLVAERAAGSASGQGQSRLTRKWSPSF